MRRRLLSLLPALVIGAWGMASFAVGAENSPPLKLAPEPQQGQANSVTLHDIRGPVELPDFSAVLFWLVTGLAVLAISGLFLYFWKRREKGGKQPGAHEIALAELCRLRSMMNPEQALVYAEQLSELLRRYIEVRFLIPSTRQTTREFFAGLSNHQAVTARNGLIPREPSMAVAVGSMAGHHDHLRACLEQCDMAKFARCVPGQLEMETMEKAVRGFIEVTGQAVAEKGKG